MSYTSKRALVSMAVGILLLIAYIVYALGDAAPAPDDLKAWALAMLVYIGACTAAGIVTQIVFHIALSIEIAVKEKDGDDKKTERILKSSMLEDEMYQLISLKSSRVGNTCSGFGFVAGLVSLAFGVSTVVVLHIVAGAFVLGAIMEGCMIIYLNEGGVRNG